jgi:AraC-like DNA-binding protein
VPSGSFDPSGIVGQADYSLLFDGSDGFAPVECGGGSAELFESMLVTYLADDVGELRRLRLSAQLLYLLTCAVSRPAESGRMKSAAREIYAWIVANFDKPITIADAAKEFHYGESYISKLLRRHYGTSFKQLVIDCRLTRAVWLMENTQRSREEIAAETGFYNGQHFLRTYLNKHGKNPALSK